MEIARLNQGVIAMIQTFPFYAIAINMDIRYVELIYIHTNIINVSTNDKAQH